MKRQTLVLATCAAIQCGLAVLWLWLKMGLETGDLSATGGDTDGAIRTFSAVIGGAMGVFGALGAVIIATRRRKAK